MIGRAMCLAGVLLFVDCHDNNLDFTGRALTGGATGSGGDTGTGGTQVLPETGGRSGSGGVAGMAVTATGGALGSGGGSGTGGAGTGGAGTGGMRTGGSGMGGLGGRGAGGIAGVAGIGSCRTDPDCALLGLHCLLTPPQPLGRCVECLGDGLGHCPTAPRVRCDTDFHRCVDCSAKVACPSGRCNTIEFRCVAIPCGSSCPAKLTCHENTLCTECEVGDESSMACANGLSCNSESLCTGCTVDTGCPTARPRCDAIRGLCVQCRVGGDCPSGACNERTGVCL